MAPECTVNADQTNAEHKEHILAQMEAKKRRLQLALSVNSKVPVNMPMVIPRSRMMTSMKARRSSLASAGPINKKTVVPSSAPSTPAIKNVIISTPLKTPALPDSYTIKPVTEVEKHNQGGVNSIHGRKTMTIREQQQRQMSRMHAVMNRLKAEKVDNENA